MTKDPETHKETTKSVKTIKPKKMPKKNGRLIYIGPNLPGGLLQKYAVYKGGIPPHLNDVVAKNPSIKRLFVDVKKLGQAEQALKKMGTPEYTAYEDVLNMKGSES